MFYLLLFILLYVYLIFFFNQAAVHEWATAHGSVAWMRIFFHRECHLASEIKWTCQSDFIKPTYMLFLRTKRWLLRTECGIVETLWANMYQISSAVCAWERWSAFRYGRRYGFAKYVPHPPPPTDRDNLQKNLGPRNKSRFSSECVLFPSSESG